MKKLITLLAGVALSQLVSAQVLVTGTSLTYTQNFDGLDTANISSTNLPTGWSIFEYGTSSTVGNPGNYKGNNGSSNAGDVYSYGLTGTTERALGSVASGSNIPSYGVTFQNTTGLAITGFTVSYRVEQWRLGQKRTAVDSTLFMYSTAASGLGDTASTTAWTIDPAGMLNTPNIVDTVAGPKNGDSSAYSTHKLFTETVNIPVGGHVVLKWLDVNAIGSDDGLAIDSFSITFTTASGSVSPRPIVLSLSPANAATGVTANSNLAITFNKAITVGTGSLKIKNETDQTTVTKTLPSTDVTVSGDVATIANTGLVLGKKYHVTFDSTDFDSVNTQASVSYHSYGIYDTTVWAFTTAAAVLTLDSLNETFNTSCPAGLPTGWTKFSVTGTQVWNCTAYGYGSEGMQMNGYTTPINYANNDWLISPKLDLSSFTTVALQFMAKKEYKGDDLIIQISSNYSGAGDPTTATWTNLNVNFAPASIDTQFHTYIANLTNYKTQPIFIGIQYISRPNATDTSAARWTVDNVQTLRGTAVAVVSNKQLQLTVVGASTTSNINLSYTATADENNEVAIYDVTGRKVYTENIHVAAGAQRIALTGLNLHTGMYIVKLSNDHSYGVVKTTVQ